MNTNQIELCREFNQKAGFLDNEPNDFLEREMLAEEMTELITALKHHDYVEIYDAICDILYVYAGTLMKQGYKNKDIKDRIQTIYIYFQLLSLMYDVVIDKDCYELCMDEVCKSNLTKNFSESNGIKKVTKDNPEYRDPELAPIVADFHK